MSSVKRNTSNYVPKYFILFLQQCLHHSSLIVKQKFCFAQSQFAKLYRRNFLHHLNQSPGYATSFKSLRILNKREFWVVFKLIRFNTMKHQLAHGNNTQHSYCVNKNEIATQMIRTWEYWWHIVTHVSSCSSNNACHYLFVQYTTT